MTPPFVLTIITITVNTEMAMQLATPAQTTALAPTTGADALIAQWRAHLQQAVAQGDLTDATATTYRNGLTRFMAWLQSSGAQVVTPKTFGAFKAGMLAANMSPASVNVWLSSARAFYAWAVESEHMKDNPARDVKGVKRKGANKTHKRSGLTDAEAVRLLALPLSARDHALIALKLFTGIRDVEASRAQLSDLKTREGRKVLYIRGKGHSDADELVVINAKCDDALAPWLAVRGNQPGALFTSASDRNQGGMMSMSAIRTLVKSAFRMAGITEADKTSHSTRHTAITKAARLAGVGAAQRMARHADPKTTMIYVAESSRLENAAEDSIDYSAK